MLNVGRKVVFITADVPVASASVLIDVILGLEEFLGFVSLCVELDPLFVG